MPSTYKTPGVYVEEISTFPPSVAQVETAVPAFIGYTQKASSNGVDLTLVPTRITSLLEYQNYFGFAYTYAPGDLNVTVNGDNAVTGIGYNNQVFRMYDSLRLFFDNGGGKCYIVSVNSYDNAAFTNGALDDSAELKAGLDETEKYDEPTILLFPDAVQLNETQFYALQQAAIEQCAKLQDRVALLDLKENLASPLTWVNSVNDFRNNIGINDLKYAMAYTPWINNAYNYAVDFTLFRNDVNAGAVDLATLTSDSTLNGMVTNLEAICDDIDDVIDPAVTALNGTFTTVSDHYFSLRNKLLAATEANSAAAFTALLQYVRSIALQFPAMISGAAPNLSSSILTSDLNSYAADPIAGLNKYAKDLVALEKNATTLAVCTDTASTANVDTLYVSYNGVPAPSPASWLGADISAIGASATDFTAGGTLTTNKQLSLAVLARTPVAAGDTNLDNIYSGLNSFLNKIVAAVNKRKTIAQNTLYSSHSIIGNMVNAIQKSFSLTPPSGAVAGVFAKVDNDRGVWKAPANVSLASVIGPSVLITNDTQDGLNVDVEAGKSINAIRAFTGKGTLIWGSRTLAGNDNEWRYVPVRRFFNMVEESVKKASSQFVFEPNDANTWVKVKAMIENYLTILWRQGALAGAKAENAFFVKVGLGETMTAIDILEGRMNIEIGMAAVRPAEFIILKFSHKMQES